MDANRSMRFQCGWSLKSYRKIPKISLGAYIFQRPFLRALFLEGFIFGGAYRLGKPHSWKEIYRFCFVLLCIWGQFPSTSPRGGLYLEGQFNGGFFCVTSLGGLHLEGLIHGVAYFRNFTVCHFWMVTLKKIRAPAAIIISFPLFFFSHSGKGIICCRISVAKTAPLTHLRFSFT